MILGNVSYLTNQLIDVIQMIAGAIIFFAAIITAYGGFLYVTSVGDKRAIEKAKMMIFNAGVGMMIALMSFMIINIFSSLIDKSEAEAVKKNENTVVSEKIETTSIKYSDEEYSLVTKKSENATGIIYVVVIGGILFISIFVVVYLFKNKKATETIGNLTKESAKGVSKDNPEDKKTGLSQIEKIKKELLEILPNQEEIEKTEQDEVKKKIINNL